MRLCGTTYLWQEEEFYDEEKLDEELRQFSMYATDAADASIYAIVFQTFRSYR